MSTIELKSPGAGNDQDAINWVLAAASPGQRIALVGKFVVNFRPIASNKTYFGAIHIPNGRHLDLSEASIVLAPNQPRMVTPNTTTANTQFAALITNSDLSNGRDIRVTGGIGPVDGNALNQKTNDCRFNGIQFRNTIGFKVEGVTVKNVRGIDGMGGPTESFVFDSVGGGSGVWRDNVATADPSHKAETSTGFSANGGSDHNLWDHCEAYGLKDHGFTSWHCSHGARIACRSHHNGSTGARWEYGQYNRDLGCTYDSNTGTGLILQGCLDHVLEGHTIVGNGSNFRQVEGATWKEGPGTVGP